MSTSHVDCRQWHDLCFPALEISTEPFSTSSAIRSLHKAARRGGSGPCKGEREVDGDDSSCAVISPLNHHAGTEALHSHSKLASISFEQ